MKHGLVAVLAVVGLLGAQAMGSATFYLSQTSLESGAVPTPSNPDITITQGNSVTLYLWAQLASASSKAMGFNYAATVPNILTATASTVWNGAIAPIIDPETQEQIGDYWRWNGTNSWISPVAGFSAVGGFDDPPPGHNSQNGLESAKAATDPTKRGAASPYHFYVGSVTFTGSQVGTTEIFMTINSTLMIGNTGMIGTTASPVLHLGLGDDAVPVSFGGGVYYIADGVKSTAYDARITVVPVPEPATIGLLALGCLSLLRRR